MRSSFLAALLLLPTVALADPAGIQVSHVWSRAMPAGATGVVYLTVTDSGAPDALVAAASPIAARAELHQTIDDHGVMKMRSVARLPVAPGRPITLQPDGYHIMLVGLKQALVAGATFPLTLTFANGGSLTATAVVAAAGAAMPGMDHGSMGSAGQGGMDKMDMHGISMGGNGSK